MKKQHILYRRDYCGFCGRVEGVIKKLNIEIELRDIWEDDASYDELEAATGRGAVPVLRIVDEQGQSK
ncbi:MAG: glutaredoxin, partial [Parvicella sp.]